MGRDEVVALLQGDVMPSARAGEALREARRAHGWKRKQVAAMLRIKPDELRAYERGSEAIPPELCAQLAEIYGDELFAQLPDREPLTIDTAHAAAEPDALLASYVEILQRLRKAKPGEDVPLRASDLAALSAALERDPDTIERQLAELLGCSRKEARALHRELLRRRVVLPVAGLAAGVVALSGAHAALASSSPPAPRPTPAPVAPVDAPVVHRFPRSTGASLTSTTTTTTTTTTTAPRVIAPTTTVPVHHASAPKPVQVTPPSIPPDDTPVSVLPGEHPIPVDDN